MKIDNKLSYREAAKIANVHYSTLFYLLRKPIAGLCFRQLKVLHLAYGEGGTFEEFVLCVVRASENNILTLGEYFETM